MFSWLECMFSWPGFDSRDACSIWPGYMFQLARMHVQLHIYEFLVAQILPFLLCSFVNNKFKSVECMFSLGYNACGVWLVYKFQFGYDA